MSFGAVDGAGVAAFLFGKLPAHGDFISRGLDDETIEAADAAMADIVAAIRGEFPDCAITLSIGEKTRES